MANILIVDDDPLFCRQLELYAERLGHESKCATSLFEGVEACIQGDFQVVFLDIDLPDASGLQGIGRFKETPTAPEVIMITGDGDPDGAEFAIRNGAWYYLEKPLAFHTVKLLVERVVEYRENIRSAMRRHTLDRAGILGNSPGLMDCLNMVTRASQSRSNVLITGETGTGKELLARAVHANSPQAEAPFVVVDCTNIPEPLAESILLGHEKGAFTDARERRTGLVTQADKGSIFFDEVGDLPPSVQRSLLRVFQERRYRPVGAAKEKTVQCRFIAATNRDLEAMVSEGSFRQDLFFRLNAFHITPPPLRERAGDLKELTRNFVDQACSENSIDLKGISTDYMSALSAYDWPGNVRELLNVVQTSVANALGEPILYLHHLPIDFKAQFFRSSVRVKEDAPLQRPEKKDVFELEELPTLKAFREKAYTELECKYLDALLERGQGDVKKLCEIADISRSRLYQILNKCGKTIRGA